MQRSLIGALALAANPVFFALSFTFMTDVPVSEHDELGPSLLCRRGQARATVPAVGGRRIRDSGVSSRQIGILIPLALLPYCVQREEVGGPPRRLLPVAVSVLGMALLWLWLVSELGRTSVMAEKLQPVRYLMTLSLFVSSRSISPCCSSSHSASSLCSSP